MKACGLIVEYNPLHYGHLYHIKESKEKANAECMIAVMSGSFLQRGEPSIIDKFHRTRAALKSGVDIVLELPFAHAVQSSQNFARGAIKVLEEIGAEAVCFGSESGQIDEFIQAVKLIKENEAKYERQLKKQLNLGQRFPVASAKAYEAIGLKHFDLMQPNNILGFSYVRAIDSLKSNISPYTIKRVKSQYHDTEIEHKIASATSIRKEIFESGYTPTVKAALPEESILAIQSYQKKAKTLHNWEKYFPLLSYQILTQSPKDLRQITGISEGLEYRIKDSIEQSENFAQFIDILSTKRYTQTRLQRHLTHILTQTRQEELGDWYASKKLPYLRLLGMTKTGQAFINKQKKNISLPIYSNLNKKNKNDLYLDEKAQEVYYSVLPPVQRITLRKQEFQLPIIQ